MTPSALRQSTEPVVDASRVNGNCLGVEGDIRLNLGGCGEGFLDSRIPGFLTMDLRDGADVVGDCSDLSRFADGSVSALYASNILEHWKIDDTVKILKEWRRVLKPNGKLYVSVPDFDAAVSLYQKIGLTKWIKYHLWGDQKHPLNYHYVCFTFASLAKDLYDAGFSDVKRVQFFNIGELDCSRSVNTLTKDPISLNVEACK